MEINFEKWRKLFNKKDDNKQFDSVMTPHVYHVIDLIQ